MNSIVININSTNNRLVTMLGSLNESTQQLVDSDPQSYIVVSDDDSIREVLSLFNMGHEETGGIPTSVFLETSLYFEDGRIVKKPNLRAIKDNRIKMLSAQCNESCLSGVTSTALGQEYFYPTQPLDQQNLAACVAASLNPLTPPSWTVVVWCCTPGDSNSWRLREHNAQQIQMLGEETLRMIETHRKHLRDLVVEIERIPDDPVEANAALVRAFSWD